MRLLARPPLCIFAMYTHTLPVKLSENDNLFRVKDLPPKEKREQNNHPLVSHTPRARGLKSILSFGDVIECLSSVEGWFSWLTFKSLTAREEVLRPNL
jgi:hypothetical protein